MTSICDWDRPISPQLRSVWIDNFKLIEMVRKFEYVRCPIPSEAVNPKGMKLWILCDHAQVVMIGVYACYKLKDGSYSVSHLMGKSMLPPEGWTIPMGELHGISASGNVKVFLEKALEGWI